MTLNAEQYKTDLKSVKGIHNDLGRDANYENNC